MTTSDSEGVFPGSDWEARALQDLGFDSSRLEQARRQIDEGAGTGPYRVVVVRGGFLAAEWNRGMPATIARGRPRRASPTSPAFWESPKPTG